MFAIKIEYKGKVINIGKGITSFDKIYQEIKNRFPVDFKYGVKCFIGDDLISDFNELKRKAQDSKLASIKLKVQPLHQQEVQLKQQDNKSQKIKQQMSPNKNKEQQKDNVIKPQAQALIQPIEVQAIAENPTQLITKEEQRIQKKQQNQNNSERSLQFQKSESSKQSKKSFLRSQKSKNNVASSIKQKQESIHQFTSQKENQPQKKSISRSASRSIKRRSISKSVSHKSFNQKSKTVTKKSSLKNQKLQIQVQKINIKQGQFLCYKCSGAKKIKKNNSQCNGQVSKNFENKDKSCMETKSFLYKLCPICEGKGFIKQNDPFIIFINGIVEKKIQDLLLKYEIVPKIEEKVSEMRQNKQKSVFKPVDISKLKFEIIQVTKMKEKVNIGQKVVWNIQIVNLGAQFPQKMQLYDEDDGFLCNIEQLKNNQSQVITLGPMIFDKKGIQEKFYKIGFVEKDQSFKLLQKKFGFKVQVVQEQKKSLLTNNFRKRVGQLAKIAKSKHSIEYLIGKFKELGINQQNGHENSNEVVSEIINSLQSV